MLLSVWESKRNGVAGVLSDFLENMGYEEWVLNV